MNLARRSAALLLVLAPLAVSVPAAAAPSAAPAAGVLALADAAALLPVADESRTGYNRDSFRHWNKGLDPADGCNTRAEVLLDEAVEAPAVEAGCKLSAGRWISYYDGAEVTDPGKLDIDHMVPLAEAWDSK